MPFYTPEIINISGSKTWNDNNDQDGKRPGSITIRLYANGEEVASKVVRENLIGTDWEWEFDNLPKYADGKEIVYTVAEDAVDGYTSVVKGYDVTNTHIPEKISVAGSKTWNDNNDQDGIRPETITVNLKVGDSVIATTTTSEANNWKYEFTGLDKYEDGKEIVYTVEESAIPDGYTATVEGHNITNTHTPEKTEVSGVKTWDDNNNARNLRPDSITVNLFADTILSGNYVITKDMDWKYLIAVNKFTEDGTEINYSITEDEVAGYNTVIDGFNIVNKIIPEPEVVTTSNNNVVVPPKTGVESSESLYATLITIMIGLLSVLNIKALRKLAIK